MIQRRTISDPVADVPRSNKLLVAFNAAAESSSSPTLAKRWILALIEELSSDSPAGRGYNLESSAIAETVESSTTMQLSIA